jgi:hypothetical protein
MQIGPDFWQRVIEVEDWAALQLKSWFVALNMSWSAIS